MNIRTLHAAYYSIGPSGGAPRTRIEGANYATWRYERPVFFNFPDAGPIVGPRVPSLATVYGVLALSDYPDGRLLETLYDQTRLNANSTSQSSIFPRLIIQFRRQVSGLPGMGLVEKTWFPVTFGGSSGGIQAGTIRHPDKGLLDAVLLPWYLMMPVEASLSNYTTETPIPG